MSVKNPGSLSTEAWEHGCAKLIGAHRMRNSDTFSLTVSSHEPLSPQFVSALRMVCQDWGRVFVLAHGMPSVQSLARNIVLGKGPPPVEKENGGGVGPCAFWSS